MEEVVEPTGSIGYLNGDPVGLVLFHSTLPVEAEVKDVFVEGIFGGAVANHESRVDEMIANQGRWQGSGDASFVREKQNPMILWIANLDDVVSGIALGNFSAFHSAGKEIFAHASSVADAKSERLHPIV